MNSCVVDARPGVGVEDAYVTPVLDPKRDSAPSLFESVNVHSCCVIKLTISLALAMLEVERIEDGALTCLSGATAH